MRRVRLDFAPAPPALAPAGIAAIAGGALAVGAALWSYGSALATHEALQASVQVRPAASSRVAGSDARGGSTGAENVLASLGLPWATLFDTLEATAGHGVVLTGFQPETEARRVRITGQARRFEDIADYAGRLQASGIFGNVQLVAHDTREQRTQFTLQADWGARP
ncbi:MAG: PilN domain-containing protein [Ramlibacter sp.]